MAAAKSISERKPAKELPLGCVRIFLLPFFLVGTGLFYQGFLAPAYRVVQARFWAPVPCVVEASWPEEHKDSEGDLSYRFRLRYRYRYGGQEYSSERFEFATMGSSGRANLRRLLAEYPAQAQRICYVNPRAPSEAVVERSFTSALWIGLFGLPFLLIGSLAFLPSKWGRRWVHTQPLPEPTPAPSLAPLAAAAVVGGGTLLRPRESRRASFFGILLFTVIWDSIVVVGIATIVSHYGFRFSWPLLFVSVFGLVGLLLLWAAIYQGLRLFTPTPQVVVEPASVPLGGRFTVRWNFPRGSEKLSELQVVLEGEEIATYVRGTDNTTDRSVFLRKVLAAVATLPAGEASTSIPAGLVPSFKSASNEIAYSVRLRSKVRGLPPLDEAFPLTVSLPAS